MNGRSTGSKIGLIVYAIGLVLAFVFLRNVDLWLAIGTTVLGLVFGLIFSSKGFKRLFTGKFNVVDMSVKLLLVLTIILSLFFGFGYGVFFALSWLGADELGFLLRKKDIVEEVDEDLPA